VVELLQFFFVQEIRKKFILDDQNCLTLHYLNLFCFFENMSGEKVDVEEPKKRGRGRPPKLDAQGNPTAVVKVVTNRKRGKPPRVPTNSVAAAREEVSSAADAMVPSSPEIKVVKVTK
jgi:hypothetical protein